MDGAPQPHSAAAARILVLGGGFAGVSLVATLHNLGLPSTLVTRTDYLDIAFAHARAMVQPSLVDEALVPLQDTVVALGGGGGGGRAVVVGAVEEVGPASVRLDDGRVLHYDLLVVATGSDSPPPWKASPGATTTAARRRELLALARRVRAARSFLVVGGGALGVELAGELLTDLPGARVTLVHSGPRLLPSLPARLGEAAAAYLASRGATLLLDDRVDVPAAVAAAAGSFEGATAASARVAADVVLDARGTRPNTGFMRRHFAGSLDASGRVRVDNHLRVVGGNGRIFCVGDANDVDEEKLAFLAGAQGDLVARSLHTLAAAMAAAARSSPTAALAASGGGSGVHSRAGSHKHQQQQQQQQAPPPPPPLLPPAAAAAAERRLGVWRPSRGLPVCFVSVGRDYGVGRIGPVTLVGCVPTRLKSRNIGAFVRKYRRQFCLPGRVAAAAAASSSSPPPPSAAGGTPAASVRDGGGNGDAAGVAAAGGAAAGAEAAANGGSA